MATGAVVTTVGKGLIAASMVADNTAKYVAMGTGTTTPAVTDTALQTPVDLNSGSAWVGVNAVQSSTKYRVTKTITAGAGRTITEVGLFKEAAMTNMLYHEVFTGIAVLNGDTVSFTIDITVG
jgi:hypothetical protein